MSEQLHRLLVPYASVTLSAFDNLKLVISVITAEISENHSSDDSQEPKPVAYEAQRKTDTGPEAFYCVQWQGVWIDCGRTNNYAASLTPLTSEGAEVIDMASLRQLDIPVLTMQQVSFMCMENSHFDHC